MFTAISGVGLVPRLNVVGVPSEARVLYVVDNDLTEAGAGDESPVRHRRGNLVRRIIAVLSPSLQVCWTTSEPGQSTDQPLPATPILQWAPLDTPSRDLIPLPLVSPMVL